MAAPLERGRQAQLALVREQRATSDLSSNAVRATSALLHAAFTTEVPCPQVFAELRTTFWGIVQMKNKMHSLNKLS